MVILTSHFALDYVDRVLIIICETETNLVPCDIIIVKSIFGSQILSELRLLGTLEYPAEALLIVREDYHYS